MKKVIGLLAAILLLSPSILCAKTDMLRDYVKLDKVFIPAYYFVRDKNIKKSARAIFELQKEWTRFYSQYKKHPYSRKDVEWKKDFENINSYIIKAEKATKRKKFNVALKYLHYTRIGLKTLRERHGDQYFIDKLIMYEEPLSDMLIYAKKKVLKNKDFIRIKGYSWELYTAWNEVRSAEINENIYGLSEKQLEDLDKMLISESKALDALMNSFRLKKFNKSKIQKAIRNIDLNFHKIYKLFGNVK